MVEDNLQPGTMVSEYRVDQLIGEGAFGKVYAATHPVIGKRAAIKVLDWQFSSKPEWVSRFVSEARAVNQIQHRNIVDIFAFGALPDGRQYFVMELLKGETVRAHLLRNGPMTVAAAVPVLRKLARALDAAHAAGIAHRDLKPDNLFLSFDEDGDCYPKLLDFGIAKLIGDGPSAHKTATGTPLGTPMYMSPEQCRGREVDHRTDIYAFGILVHEMLTGRPPFADENLMDLMMNHMSTPAPSMSSTNHALPAPLDPPVQQMLEKDPDLRPQTVGAAVEALEQAARAAGIELTGAVAAAPPADLGVSPTVLSDGALDDGQAPMPTDAWLEGQSGAAAEPMPMGYPHQQGAAPVHAMTPGPHQPTDMAGAYTAAGAMRGPMQATPQQPNRTMWWLGGSLGLGVLALVIVAVVMVVQKASETTEGPTAGNTTAPPGGLHIRSQVLSPGTTVVSDVSGNTQLQGPAAKFTQVLRSRRTISVLAANAQRVTGIRVLFHEHYQEETLTPGSKNVHHSPVTGKSYLVGAPLQPNRLHVKRVGGAAASAEEIEPITEELQEVFEPNKLAPLIAGKPLAAGQAIMLTPGQAKALLTNGGDDVDFTVAAANLTVRNLGKVDGLEVVRFDMAVTLTFQANSSELGARLAGTLGVRKDTCWVVDVSLNGPISYKQGNGTGLAAKHLGKISYTMSNRFGRAGGGGM